MSDIRYALIGCGRIAVNHIRAAIENRIYIVAICDINASQMDSLLDKTECLDNVERYQDYKEMIQEHPDISLIAIATDSGSHAEIAMYCINHGINVIIEKPMALSMQDADEIIRQSQNKGIKVTVCHQNRFNDAIQKTRIAIDENRLGKISHGAIHVRWNRDKEYYEQASWRGKWDTDGGCLFNQCIHGIDLLRWMMGDDVDEVYGITRRQFHDDIECEDLGMALVKFKNGALGTIEGSVNIYPKNLEETLYIFGRNGTVKIGGKAVNKIEVWEFVDKRLDESMTMEDITSIYGNGHIRLYKDMAEAIERNRIPYIDAVAGRNAVEMVLAIYLSALTGKPVKLPLQNISSSDFAGQFDNIKK